MSPLTTAPFRPAVLYLAFEGVLHPSDLWLPPDGSPTPGEGFVGHQLFEHVPLLVELLWSHPVFGIAEPNVLPGLKEALGRVWGSGPEASDPTG